MKSTDAVRRRPGDGPEETVPVPLFTHRHQDEQFFWLESVTEAAQRPPAKTTQVATQGPLPRPNLREPKTEQRLAGGQVPGGSGSLIQQQEQQRRRADPSAALSGRCSSERRGDVPTQAGEPAAPVPQRNHL